MTGLLMILFGILIAVRHGGRATQLVVAAVLIVLGLLFVLGLQIPALTR